MRTTFLIIIVFFLSIYSPIVYAQNTDPGIGAGVYLTYQDFTNRNLSFTVNFNVSIPFQMFKCKRNFFSYNTGNIRKIKIITPDTLSKLPASATSRFWWGSNIRILKFPKGTIYGYYFKGDNYRYFTTPGIFSPHGYFKIIEQGTLIIYSQYHLAHNGTIHLDGDNYYYSLGLNTPIKTLNKKNLIQDFSDKLKFVEAVKKIKWHKPLYPYYPNWNFELNKTLSEENK